MWAPAISRVTAPATCHPRVHIAEQTFELAPTSAHAPPDLLCLVHACEALMAQMVTLGGSVTAIDNPTLCAFARLNIAKSWSPLLEGVAPTITVIPADGYDGVPGAFQFTAIHVGATAASVPADLLRQLTDGGRMLIPIGSIGGEQVLHVVDKAFDGTVHDEETLAVRFPPLVPNMASRTAYPA